ncbi:unnamed protein product [Psylliodes chrysocephalus]|uniref:Uncharacterized protein n=1 Tax=Psylliodes chrysocephalus TaxID=3402493 RepID=A0A9P0D424_9CUCU|nr:unnamed protein product [Psylliodes chrysocephala]
MKEISSLAKKLTEDIAKNLTELVSKRLEDLQEDLKEKIPILKLKITRTSPATLSSYGICKRQLYITCCNVPVDVTKYLGKIPVLGGYSVDCYAAPKSCYPEFVKNFAEEAVGNAMKEISSLAKKLTEDIAKNLTELVSKRFKDLQEDLKEKISILKLKFTRTSQATLCCYCIRKQQFNMPCCNVPIDVTKCLVKIPGLGYCVDCYADLKSCNPEFVKNLAEEEVGNAIKEISSLAKKLTEDIAKNLTELVSKGLKDLQEDLKEKLSMAAVKKITEINVNPIVCSNTTATSVSNTGNNNLYFTKLKSTSAVIIKPKDSSQNNSVTKADILNAIDPVGSNIQIFCVKNIRDGEIVIGSFHNKKSCWF